MAVEFECDHCGVPSVKETRVDGFSFCVSCMRAHLPYTPGQEKMCRTAGCSAYMRYPFRRAKLEKDREDVQALVEELDAAEVELQKLQAAVESNDKSLLPEDGKLCIWQFGKKYVETNKLPYTSCPRSAQENDDYCVSHRRMIDNGRVTVRNKDAQVINSNGKSRSRLEKKNDWVVFGRKKEGLTPINAMMALIYEAAGNVEYYRDRINEEERLVIAGRKEKEEITGLVRLYNEERDRLENYLKDGFRIGLEQRYVKLLQLQAKAMVTIFKRLIHSLNLDDNQRKIAFTEIASGLRTYALESGATQWRGPFLEARSEISI